MLEYTRAYLNPFPWAKAAYDYSMGLSATDLVAVTDKTLTAPIVPQLPQGTILIETDVDWNINTKSHASVLNSLYRSLDQAEAYIQNLYTRLNARLTESEDRVQKNEQDLKALRSTLGLSSTTSITVKGGDLSSIDLDPRFYRDSGPLKSDVQEGVFRLPDTGYFSSLRSLGGYAGTVRIDRQLGHMVEVGGLESLVDGGRTTFWMGTHYSPAPMRVDTNDIPWLPDNYKHGFAFMVTYYLDRPTLASEIFVDPVTTEPFHLVSVSYTPWGISNILQAATFEASGSWTYGTGTSRLPGVGVDNSYGALVVAPSGFLSQTFDLVHALNKSVSGVLVAATSGDVLDTRVEIIYNMKGMGDCKAGVRLVWLDAAGNVINYKLKQDFPTGFYQNLRLVDFAPALAVSGRIDLGIFTQTQNASAYFDNAVVYVGEQRKHYNQMIDRPTTLLIRNNSGAVLSQRFSFVFVQTNPRREILAKETANARLQTITGLLDVDPSAQQATVSLSQELGNPGSGEQIFAYRVGLKELDIRNREFVPRGNLVTYPLKTRREIRRMWVTSELSKAENEGVTFSIYPFSSDQNTRISVNPYLLGDLDETQYSTGVGQILYIFTKEEVASGWARTAGDSTLLVDPRPTRDQFDGTDRDGRVRLTDAPHLRRPELQNISQWLDSVSAKPGVFDPNAETIYGILNDSIRNSIRSGAVSGLTMSASAITSRAGYVPMRVTVRTDKWTAYQDTFGRPDTNFVQYVEREQLEATDVHDTVTSSQDDSLGFEAWLNATPFYMCPEARFLAGWPTIPPDERMRSLRWWVDLNTTGINANSAFKTYTTSRMLQIYNQYKAQGKIPKDTSQVNSQVATVSRAGAYKTRYTPIVSGPAGIYIQLFWFNSTTGMYLAVPRNSFKVRPDIGLVTMQKDPPDTGYDKVIANYWYVPDTTVEDYSSQTLSYLTESSSSMSLSHSYSGMRARSYPVCRNMTDYQNGKVPDLKVPDFDPLSRNYYPVIEYFVTADNEVQFARDFFRYGDIPAQVEVEYLTLGLNPRAAVNVERGGSPTASSSISSFSLFVKEGAAVPLREVE